MNGPFKPGKWNDMKIFRSRLHKKLILEGNGEKIEADMGYRGEFRTVRHPRDYISLSDKKAKKKVRARHETINRRFKQFTCIRDTWRHDISKHKYAFMAVVVLTQLSFDAGGRPFHVTY